MPDLDEYRVEEWLEAVADSYGKELEDMTYRFIDDEAMLAYNREYLGHDYYTDIIEVRHRHILKLIFNHNIYFYTPSVEAIF